MPRTGQPKQLLDDRLSDRITIAIILEAFPPDLVDEVISCTGRASQRNRLLPARMVVYLVLAMCLFPDLGYQQVARMVTRAMAGTQPLADPWQVPTTAAICRARARLGPEPLKALFERVARRAPTPVPELRGRPVVAVSPLIFQVPVTPPNVAAYGPAQAQALPRVPVVALIDCGSGNILRAAVGAAHPGLCRTTGSDPALRSAVRAGMLLVAGRHFPGARDWATVRAAGADLVWRPDDTVPLPVRRPLDDGSYLSDLVTPTTPFEVRVVSYPAGRGGRLVTSVCRPDGASADELNAAYRLRRRAAAVMDAFTTGPAATAIVLRSQQPGGAEQEIWAYLALRDALSAFLR